MNLNPHLKSQLLSHLEPYAHVIWDWNGTLLDDVDLVIRVTNRILAEFHLPELTLERYKDIFQFPVKTYYQALGYDFSKTPFEVLCDRFMHEYHLDHSEHSRLFADVPSVLEILGRTKRQSILSAGSQSHLDVMTQHHGIAHHFSDIYGIENNQATSKLARGRELIKNAGIPLQTTILVGDTDHDLEVGTELGIDVLLVADGHQSFERLAIRHPRVLRTRF